MLTKRKRNTPNTNVNSKQLSIVLTLLFVFIAFEVFIRIPYAINLTFFQTEDFKVTHHFFSGYAPWLVLTCGSALLLAVCFVIMVASKLVGGVMRLNHNNFAPYVSNAVYIPVILQIIFCIYSIFLVGSHSLIDDISAKRDVFEVGILGYVVLKLATFTHIVIAMIYIRALQKGKVIDWSLMLVLTLLLFAVSIVYSSRASIITLGIELLYIQFLFRKLNLRKLITLGLYFLPVLLAISVLRAVAVDDVVSFGEAINTALEKLAMSRYFLDVPKLGSVFLWTRESEWLGMVSINWMFEFFSPDSFISYKDAGPLIASEVYNYSTETGVTLGAFLEGIVSFGVIGGILFFFVMLLFFLKIEKKMLKSKQFFFFYLLILGHFGLFINSSFGAFVYKTLIEFALLSCVMMYFAFYKKLAKI